MGISKNEYNSYVQKESPNSKSVVNIPYAFVVGGIICCLGEFINTVFSNYGFDEKSAGTWTSIVLVLISALLTGFGLYSKIAKHAGAGTLVPITGFANAVVAPALDSKTEGYVLGVGAKIFLISGPVILYGVAASFVYGLVCWIFKL